MQRATTSGSGERTPLVQPTYVFESSVSRRYQKRLRSFQCVMCFCIITFMAIALLVTVSYNIRDAASDNSTDADDTAATVADTAATVAPAPAPAAAAGNLTLLTLSAGRAAPLLGAAMTPPDMELLANSSLGPVLAQEWPLKGTPYASWSGSAPDPATISAAVARGKAALQQRHLLESARVPLPGDSPAKRAQRAASTARDVKPLADAGYAAEQATRALVTGMPVEVPGSVGHGPATNNSFLPLRYCMQEAAQCPPSKFRSIDGSCNNLQRPLRWGVSKTPFRRLLPPAYGDGISSPRMAADGGPLPSARDVSVTVHRPSYAHDTAFTVMLAVWGQFLDHDITATALSKGQNSSALSCCAAWQAPHPECFPVPLAPEDPFYQQYNLTCMEFVRSASAPTCNFGPREQLNQATAYIDGSTVYGFSETRTKRLRAWSGGRLATLLAAGRELLPPSTDPDDGCNSAAMIAKGRYCFESGDDRANENLHLTTMHLVWARQHNAVAAQLARLNPAWDDERLFQEARRVVGAQMQHISYSEFLPLVLGSDVMWALNLTVQTEGYWAGYDPDVDASIANHFSAAAFRFAHTLLPGLIHNAELTAGSVSYTQLHRMLFNPYSLYTPRGAQEAVASAIITPIHGGSTHVTSELSEHLFEQPAPAAANTTFKKPAPCGLDLVSLNIQRGRDHGLRGYVWWREACGFPRPATLEDLREVFDASSYDRIATIYRSVEDIDLYTGALAEQPGGRLLGATLTCLLADQFLRLKRGDRYWYESGDPVTGFTIEQLTEIRKTTLAGVLCANEIMLDQAQPRVMQVVDAANPLVDCRELPQPDWSPWAEKPPTPPETEGKPSKKGKKKH